MSHYQAQQKPDNNPFIWIRCFEAGKRLKHAGQGGPRTRIENHCSSGYNATIEQHLLIISCYRAGLLQWGILPEPWSVIGWGRRAWLLRPLRWWSGKPRSFTLPTQHYTCCFMYTPPLSFSHCPNKHQQVYHTNSTQQLYGCWCLFGQCWTGP